MNAAVLHAQLLAEPRAFSQRQTPRPQALWAPVAGVGGPISIRPGEREVVAVVVKKKKKGMGGNLLHQRQALLPRA